MSEEVADDSISSTFHCASSEQHEGTSAAVGHHDIIMTRGGDVISAEAL